MEPSFNVKESSALNFYNQLSSTIKGDYQKEMITELFKKLIGDSISNSHFEHKEGKIEVSVTLKNSINTVLEGKTLHIPKTLRFNIRNQAKEDTYLEFDDQGKDAPCTDNANSFIIKSQHTWWEVHVKNRDESHFIDHTGGVWFFLLLEEPQKLAY